MHNLRLYVAIQALSTFILLSVDSQSVNDNDSNPKMSIVNVAFFTLDEVNFTESTYIIPTTFKEISYSCVSSYPTEWKFAEAPHSDETIKDIRITKRRKLTDKYKKYIFESNLTIRFKDPTRVQNITCRGVKRYKLQHKNTSAIAQGHPDYINITMLEQFDTQVVHENRNREGMNDNCSIQLQLDESAKKFYCSIAPAEQNSSPEANDGTEDSFESQDENDMNFSDDNDNDNNVPRRLYTCNTNDECNAIYKADICKNSVVPYCNHTGCKSLNPSLQPAVIVCKSGLSSLARRYFVTNSLGQDTNFTLHFANALNESNCEISISPCGTVYSGVNFTVACTAASWCFSYGFVWNITHEGKEIQFITGAEKLDEVGYVYRDNQTIHLDHSGSYEIICSAPVWNSYNWVNHTYTINITEPQKPGNITLVVGNEGENTTLICKATGDPPPEYKWQLETDSGTSSFERGQKNAYYTESEDNDTTYSKITIHKTKSIKRKKFLCNASNFVGHVNGSYEIISEDTSERDRKIRHIVYSVVSVITTMGFCVACFIIRKQRNRLKELSDDDIYEFRNGNPDSNNAMLLPYNLAYEIPFEKIYKEGIVLGEGQFAQVVTGKVENEDVAIKTIKPSAEVMYLKALLSELKILCYVGQHPNIVNLIGASTKNIKKREVYIIMEYCANGSMLKYLRKSREHFISRIDPGDGYQINRKSMVIYENAVGTILSTRDLARWAYEIASGMEFLRVKNVIHGDLAARNVLLTANMQAKVGDFGLAKQLFEYSIYIQKLNCPLPLKWMALESLQDLEFSLDSDVWSYGVTLWEIFSLGQTPYPGIQQWDFESYKLLKGGYRMETPDYANTNIYNLMLQCWNSNPKERPSFEYLKICFQDEMMRL